SRAIRSDTSVGVHQRDHSSISRVALAGLLGLVSAAGFDGMDSVPGQPPPAAGIDVAAMAVVQLKKHIVYMFSLPPWDGKSNTAYTS
ncbi:MAG: hypothetical protein ACM338_10895, partial [Betaproteobacteria bacterium]